MRRWAPSSLPKGSCLWRNEKPHVRPLTHFPLGLLCFHVSYDTRMQPLTHKGRFISRGRAHRWQERVMSPPAGFPPSSLSFHPLLLFPHLLSFPPLLPKPCVPLGQELRAPPSGRAVLQGSMVAPAAAGPCDCCDPVMTQCRHEKGTGSRKSH